MKNYKEVRVLQDVIMQINNNFMENYKENTCKCKNNKVQNNDLNSFQPL